MKKRVAIVLEVESEDEINMDDRFIQQDLEQEISCASNRYEMISFRTQKLEKENKKMNSDNKRCWLFSGCPCRTAGCYGLPDDGCPVYRWFRKLIEERYHVQEQQWHPYDPFVGDESLKDHYYYLVMVRGRKTPMKAKYHDDSPFGFEPVDGYFDGLDVTKWRELPGSED